MEWRQSQDLSIPGPPPLPEAERGDNRNDMVPPDLDGDSVTDFWLIDVEELEEEEEEEE